jgi:hypothetical protein
MNEGKPAFTVRPPTQSIWYQACEEKPDVALVKRYIASGGDVNWSDGVNGTALMAAAWRGHAELVTALLEAGADPLLYNYRYNVASEMARDHGYPDIAAQLEAAEQKALQNGGQDPAERLWVVMMREAGREDGAPDIALVRNCIAGGAGVNWSGSAYDTALMRAAFHGHGELVTALLDAGADPRRTDIQGDTACMYALRGMHQGLARRLVAAEVTFARDAAPEGPSPGIRVGHALTFRKPGGPVM